MRYLNNYSLFLENNPSVPPTSSNPPLPPSGNQVPTNYNEFETMFEKYIQQNGGLEKDINLTEENMNSWLASMMNGGESRRQSINEGGLFGLILGGILSAGKLIEIIGQLFRHLVNWAKRCGFISGQQWKSTKLEEWGAWYTELLKKWIFKPAAKALLHSAQPFLHMAESVFNKGELTSYTKEEDVDSIADSLFYGTLIIVLSASAGAAGHAIGLIMIGKLKVLAVLKTLFTGVKIWEIKHYLLGYVLKFKKPFQKYTVEKIAHSLTECHEDYGLRASLYYDFDKFTTTKVYDCVMKHLEHH